MKSLITIAVTMFSIVLIAFCAVPNARADNFYKGKTIHFVVGAPAGGGCDTNDYSLGDESMKIMAKRGEFVNRKGVYPPLPDADKIQLVEMVDLNTKEFAEKKKEYKKIFLHE